MIRSALVAFIGGAVVGGLLVAHHYGGRIDAVRAEYTQAALVASERHRKQEAEWAEVHLRTLEKVKNERDQIKFDAERTLAERDSGTLELRKRFQACERRLSDANSSSGGIHADAEYGLTREDEEFLVRLAQEKDDLAWKLIFFQEREKTLRTH